MIQGLNNLVSYKVKTTKGDIPVEKINIGDKVLSYYTGEELEVKDVVKSELSEVWNVFYTDGRMARYCSDSLIYTGDTIRFFKDCINEPDLHKIFKPLNQYQINFNNDTVKDQLNPDPYLAGALYVYGDFDDEYVNLPITASEGIRLFINKYLFDDKILEDPISLENHRIHFRSSKTNELITWKEFFPIKYLEYPLTYTRLIPNEYMYSTVKNRIQFISGILDVNFRDDIFHTNPGVVNSSKFVLEQVQSMLHSLGVISLIRYDPSISKFKGYDYRLDIMRTSNQWPAFFYSIKNIETLIRETDTMGNEGPNFSVLPKMIQRKVSSGYTYNLVLDKPGQLYLSSNYLPRVSLL